MHDRAAAAIQAEIAASGEPPLDFMLRVMRDETAEPARRAAMAIAAAPYVHPRLAAVAHRHTNPDGSPVRPTVNVILHCADSGAKSDPRALAEPLLPISDKRPYVEALPRVDRSGPEPSDDIPDPRH
jgi:hypothetical protein